MPSCERAPSVRTVAAALALERLKVLNMEHPNGWEILHGAAQGLCIFDSQLRQAYVNEKAEQAFLASGPELYLQLKNLSRQMFRTLQSGTFTGQSGILRPAGKLLYYQCFSVYQNGKPYICCLFDYHASGYELPGEVVFTPREREILQAIIQGKTNREIGEIFCISLETVKTHIRNVLAKAGAGSRTELIGKVIPAAVRAKDTDEPV